MLDLNLKSSASKHSQQPIALSELDLALTAQIAVAWAGESGEEKRLGWWRSNLASEFGGEDLFRRLLPHTWEWAVLQAVREAARRKDAELRAGTNDADVILSLFHLGFDLEERLDERLQDLKRSGRSPTDALPGLGEVIQSPWKPGSFLDWVQGHDVSDAVVTPAGRRLKGNPPAGLERLVRRLVGGLAPLADAYPLPHFRRGA